MYDTTILDGRRVEQESREWAPLEHFLPLLLCGAFMWMDTLELESGAQLFAYKHSDTRAYLLLDADGDSWESLGHGRYRRMRHSEAIGFVFDSAWLLDHATDDERAALKRAYQDAWERGNGDKGAGAHILPCSPASGFRELPDARVLESAASFAD